MATANLTTDQTKSKYHGRAEECASRILQAFQNPETLPAALAPIFIRRNDPDVPCRKWSFGNQLLVALFSEGMDARGFRQWKDAGRHVIKGGHGFPILVPIKRTFTKMVDGKEERVTIVTGFTSTIVFGVDQTDGKPLPQPDPAIGQWIESLPFVEVARQWGIRVDACNGKERGPMGKFTMIGTRPVSIVVGVQNLSTWAHELIHAADLKNGTLVEKGQHWLSETVAELGGAVLLSIAGQNQDADLGGCWRYVSAYAADAKLDPASACIKALNRTCEAVALVLNTAETIREGGAA